MYWSSALRGSLKVAADTTVSAQSDEEIPERVQELIDKFDEEVNKSGPSNSTLRKAPPTEEDNTRTEWNGPELPTTQLEHPDGCLGRTDNPHKSTTNPLNANVHATTECPGQDRKPVMGVYTQLYKWECNPACGWEAWAPPGYRVRFIVWTVTTNSANECLNGNYKGMSTHWLTEWNGDEYTATTQNQQYIGNC